MELPEEFFPQSVTEKVDALRRFLTVGPVCRAHFAYNLSVLILISVYRRLKRTHLFLSSRLSCFGNEAFNCEKRCWEVVGALVKVVKL